MKLCIYCGGEIRLQKAKKFCSSLCNYKYWTKERSPKYGETVCEKCGKTFIKFNKSNRFCSGICHDEWWKVKQIIRKEQRALEKASCIICGKQFKKWGSIKKFCSQGCRSKACSQRRSKRPKTKICKTCSRGFEPYTSLDKFCSALCRIEDLKLKRSMRWNEVSTKKRLGELNPSFKTGCYVRGKDGNRGKLDYKQSLLDRTRKTLLHEMRQDFGYTFCQRCSQSTDSLSAHHIIYRSEAPKHENLHNRRNLILICMLCHKWFHKAKTNRKELVQERKLWELFPEILSLKNIP